MEDSTRQVDSRPLNAALGLRTDSEETARHFREAGLRKPKGEVQEFCSESISWYPKYSVRVNLYRGKTFSEFSCREVDSPTAWYIGGIEFLARGADDRIKATFSSILPCGLKMHDKPSAFVQCLGLPNLDTVLVWPGYRGRMLAWRREDSCIAVTFETDSLDSAVLTYSSCVLGCVGAWTETWPAVFAANAA